MEAYEEITECTYSVVNPCKAFVTELSESVTPVIVFLLRLLHNKKTKETSSLVSTHKQKSADKLTASPSSCLPGSPIGTVSWPGCNSQLFYNVRKKKRNTSTEFRVTHHQLVETTTTTTTNRYTKAAKSPTIKTPWSAKSRSEVLGDPDWSRSCTPSVTHVTYTHQSILPASPTTNVHFFFPLTIVPTPWPSQTHSRQMSLP